MTQPQAKTKRRPMVTNKQLMVLLILTVTLVLLALIFSGGQTWLVVLAVMIVLIALILVVGGVPELLPKTLATILREIRRILRP